MHNGPICRLDILGEGAPTSTIAGSSPPTNYLTFNGTDPNDSNTGGQGNGYGDDYNVGYKYMNLTGFSFYGGDTDPYQSSANLGLPNQYGVNLIFYNLTGGKVASIQLPNAGVYGIGYHSLSLSDLTASNGGTLPTFTGSGYFTFQPYYADLINSSGTIPVPSTRPQFTFGYTNVAPTTGANDPTYSVQTSPTFVNGVTGIQISKGAYASGGDATAQYGSFEIDGTGLSVNGTTPVWSAIGSGNWGITSNWTYGVPNAVDSTANFDEGITANSTVTVTTAQTVGTVNFDNPLFQFTVSGTSLLTLTTSTGPAIINSWSGSHTISCPIAFTSGLTVTTFSDPSASSPALALPLAITATGTLTKTGSGTLAFAPSTGGITTLNLPAIAITAGTLSLSSNNNPHNNRTLLLTSALSITGGRLDLGNNDLDLTGGGSAALTQFNTFAAQGFSNGNWNGPTGLTSSATASNSTHLTALGVIQNNQSGTAIYKAANKFDGTAPGTADILVKYTYYGDANLDGKVDGSDYSRIDSAYLADRSNPTAVTGWYNGDFNYDGVINGSDYTLIDNAFNSQGASLASSIAAPLAANTAQIARSSSVPEPASFRLLGLTGVGLLIRRKRNCQLCQG